MAKKIEKKAAKPSTKSVTKVAVKETAVPVAKARRPFALLSAEGGEMVNSLREQQAATQARSKKYGQAFQPLGAVDGPALGLPNMLIEYLMGARYVRGGTLFELIGKPGFGKTTLLMTLFGHWVRSDTLPWLGEAEESPCMSNTWNAVLARTRKRPHKSADSSTCPP